MSCIVNCNNILLKVFTVNLLTLSNSASFLNVEYASSYPLERR